MNAGISTARAALPSGANGITRNIGPPMIEAPMIVRPTPNRFEIRFALNAASSGPTLLSVNASPIASGLRCSSRRANTSSTAKPMFPQKLKSAVQAAMFFRNGCEST